MWLPEPIASVVYVTRMALTSRVDRMPKQECPHCGGRPIEKHDETVTERGNTIVFVYFRCLRCGKWTKRERS